MRRKQGEILRYFTVTADCQN